MNTEQSQNKPAHRKISQDQQRKIIQLVFRKRWQIKKAASHLDINYASAKSIISRYRRTSIRKKPLQRFNSKTCNYKIKTMGPSQFQVITTFGGFHQD